MKNKHGVGSLQKFQLGLGLWMIMYGYVVLSKPTPREMFWLDRGDWYKLVSFARCHMGGTGERLSTNQVPSENDWTHR